MNKPCKFYIESFWKVIKVAYQLMHGIWKINKLSSPVVTIFGGARWHKSPYEQQAHDLAALLIQHNISVITGGGPGIMEAANCGAAQGIKTTNSTAKSIGITVKGLEHEPFNTCAQEKLMVDSFLVRKWLMINYSVAFAIFPGGFGTIDELGEVLTLMQTKKLAGIPIVLYGSLYWQPFLDWIRHTLLKNNIISQADFELIQVTDSIEEALKLLKERCEICQ